MGWMFAQSTLKGLCREKTATLPVRNKSCKFMVIVSAQETGRNGEGKGSVPRLKLLLSGFHKNYVS